MKILSDTSSSGAVILSDEGEILAATTSDNLLSLIGSKTSSFDTGLIPQYGDGLLRYRTFNEFSQLTYQIDKGRHLVKWGKYERSSDQKVFNLAMPYRVFVADFHKDLLVGIRHFYSTDPIESLDQPLYHSPFPNTNCQGYGGTSVGWTCLYRNGSQTLTTLTEKIQYAYRRDSGIDEPYNDANMSGTDGPRFYKTNKIGHYANGETWLNLSNKEDISFFCDTKNLIQIKTSDKYHTKHDSSGKPYTLDKAINDFYYPYYEGRLSNQEKPFYEAGWANATSSSVAKLSPQDINKLSSVDFPKELKVEDFVSKFGYQIKPEINIESIDYENLSKFVLNLRDSCFICKSYNTDMTPFFLLFDAEIPKPNISKNLIYSHSDESVIVPLVNNVIDLETPDLKSCSSCNTNGYSLRIPVESEEEGLDYEIASFLTLQGFEYLSISNSDKDKLSTTSENLGISHYFVPGYTAFEPYQYILECLYCKDYHFQTNDFSFIKHLGILEEKDEEGFEEIVFHRNLIRCISCIPSIEGVLQNEELNEQDSLYDILLNLNQGKKLENEYYQTQLYLSKTNEDFSFETNKIFSIKELENLRFIFPISKFGSVIDCIVDSNNQNEISFCACNKIIDKDEPSSIIEGIDNSVCKTCNIGGTYVSIYK